ncbi:MAG TPA: hypothetical protein VFB44_04390 [Thermoleophilaceae bacterium]|jgi:hypothetical protein|nr:hypothetical protein [Thermoleophilaceae bacterium]
MLDGTVTTEDLRRQVAELEVERALAQRNGLGEIAAYMDDLDEELEYRRHLYVAASVTEIALQRAELLGVYEG